MRWRLAKSPHRLLTLPCLCPKTTATSTSLDPKANRRDRRPTAAGNHKFSLTMLRNHLSCPSRTRQRRRRSSRRSTTRTLEEQRHDAIQDRSPIAGHGMEASNERALRLESS